MKAERVSSPLRLLKTLCDDLWTERLVKTMKRCLGLLILIVFLVSLAAPLTAQEVTPQPVGLRPDAPIYALHGPYWVGYQPLTIGEGTDRQLAAHIWYPALNPNGDPETITYQGELKDSSLPAELVGTSYGHALLNAGQDTTRAPYPLIVFSHGFGVAAPTYSQLIEHYTSYGFVVIAPEHLETFDFDYSDLWTASIDRPRDVKQVLDFAEGLTAADGAMPGLIDMQHVAVAGHSYGGYTALAMAGAQYDLKAFNARCDALAEDDPATFLCAPLVSREADLAARAGLSPMPDGLWPSFGDARVTAILPMASNSYLFDQAGLAKITIPMMAIGGTIDTGTPYNWGVKPAYDYASSAQKSLVTIENAEHPIFMDTCNNLPWVTSELAYYSWVCFEPVWDKIAAST